jgi:hypothetical protein
MNEYLIKVGFWLRAFDSVTVEAPDDASALTLAKIAATTVMSSHNHPESIDFDERREGTIAYIDRIDPDGREEVVGYVPFDADRLHAPVQEFIERIASSPVAEADEGFNKHQGLPQYHALIAEAKALRSHVA